jgi:hypothetical protein
MRRPALMFVLAGLVGALIAVPVAVYASHSFTDVPDSNTFHADIAWLSDAGITKGCNPPENTEYCPDENVTRGQMAAFLHRGAPVITRFLYDGSSGDATVGNAYELHRTIGSFVKVSDGTAILLDWNAHGSSSGGFCEFQLRIDGLNDNGSSSTAFENAGAGAVVFANQVHPIAVKGLFTGLAAGEHSVEIWLRGSATTCGLNSGDFGQTIIVTETPYSEGVTVAD